MNALIGLFVGWVFGGYFGGKWGEEEGMLNAGRKLKHWLLNDGLLPTSPRPSGMIAPLCYNCCRKMNTFADSELVADRWQH